MRDTKHSHVRRDSFVRDTIHFSMCVRRACVSLSHMGSHHTYSDRTYMHMGHDSFVRDIIHSVVCETVCASFQKHCMCGMNHSHVGHDSVVRDIVHSYVCEVRVCVPAETLCVWHDSSVHGT